MKLKINKHHQNIAYDSAEKSCIILFVKYPQPGKVKTRLSKDISANTTAALYTCFVNDVLAYLSSVNADIHIYYAPPNTYRKFKAWMGTAYSYSPQRGHNLGERLIFLPCNICTMGGYVFTYFWSFALHEGHSLSRHDEQSFLLTMELHAFILPLRHEYMEHLEAPIMNTAIRINSTICPKSFQLIFSSSFIYCG